MKKMSRTELIIQLLKVAIGLAFGGYFVWWSLQVLDRLTPEYDGTAMVDRIFKSNPSAELRMPAMHQWPEMAEEEAIKTDNDSWRFKGETTIGLQPARAVSATPTGSDGASALEPMTSVDDNGECFGACVLVERQAYAALLLQKSIGASTHALKRRRQKSRSLLSSDGNAEKLFQAAKQPPELAEIQGISDKEIRLSLSVTRRVSEIGSSHC